MGNIEKERWFDLGDCVLCPVECHVNRFRKGDGFCGSDAGINIATICLHKGEEPSIAGQEGICNIFFSGCNLRCIYCQNHEISRNNINAGIKRKTVYSKEKALNIIEDILEKGVKTVGFVSPSHVVPQMAELIKGLRDRGRKPIFVYNTSGYDRVSTIKSLEGLIDVYLPDLKYVSPSIALQYSGAIDYPGIALDAIKEMYHQKGSSLLTDEQGQAESGLIIRHLVLPGHINESKKVLQRIAEELSPGVHISLMSQYYPTKEVMDHPLLNRPLLDWEYTEIVGEMERLGFRNGWVQQMDSCSVFQPDFTKNDPFIQ